MTKLLILDKDGTLVAPKSGGTFVQHPEDQQLLPGVADAIARYAADGWQMAIASNQGGVTAGYKTLEDAIAEMRFCLSLLPQIPRAYFCPDDGDTCISVPAGNNRIVEASDYWGDDRWRYRKPDPGLIYMAMRCVCGVGDVLERVKMVGDRPEDQQSAIAAGVPFLWAEEWRAHT